MKFWTKLSSILLGCLLLLLAPIAYFFYVSSDDYDLRLKRLQACIDLKMPEALVNYKAQGIGLGEQKVWLDWLDPEEYATYGLLKDGKEIEKRFALFSTDADHQRNNDHGCQLSETDTRL